jgi:hypothetical protein
MWCFDVSAGERGVVTRDGHRVSLIEFRADRVGEIALQALRDRARGRRRDITEELYGRVNWPVAGPGRILSPRSTAEFDGE